MSLPATDDFAGTGALSGNWTVLQGSASRNGGVWQGGGGSSNQTYWTADSPGDDHYAQCVVVTRDSNGGGPAVRVGPGPSLYQVLITPTATFIGKTVAGSFSFVATGLPVVAAGSVVKFTCVGTALELFDDGVSIWAGIDGSLATGTAGIDNFGTTGQYDDFEVSYMGDPPPIPLVSYSQSEGHRPAPFKPGVRAPFQVGFRKG